MPSSSRNTAVDVFRGITIALMIIVNNQGDWSHVYRPFRHAAWHGWLGADIVFPFFVFIMGVSISYSFSARHDRGDGKGGMALKILRRSAILIGLGLFINLFPKFEFATMRIPGVLQRVGICYFFASMIFLYCGKKTRWTTAVLLLAGYGVILKYLAPGGPGDQALSPGGNICLAVDRFLLAGHTYEHASVPGFDPEGILSTLGALTSALAGTFAGDWMIKSGERSQARAAIPARGAMFMAGIAALVFGAALGYWIPINKNLWTPSYAVFMAGMALALLAALHWLIEEKRLTAWSKPFLVLGVNAIAAYVLSSAVGKFLALVKIASHGGGYTTVKTVLFNALFASWLTPPAASLAYATAYLALWIGLMFFLYRRHIMIKI